MTAIFLILKKGIYIGYVRSSNGRHFPDTAAIFLIMKEGIYIERNWVGNLQSCNHQCRGRAGKAVQITGAWSSGRWPGAPLCCIYFVLCSTIICRLYRLTLWGFSAVRHGSGAGNIFTRPRNTSRRPWQIITNIFQRSILW